MDSAAWQTVWLPFQGTTNRTSFIACGQNVFQWEVKGIFCEYYNKFLVMSSLHRLLLSSSTNHTKVECSGLEKDISDCFMADEYGPVACDGGQALVMCTDSEWGI